MKDKFPQFSHLLCSLSTQAVKLRNLNKKMPKGMRVPDDWFDKLDISSNHVQMIEDLESFFIVPQGILKKVIEYQVRLVKLTQPVRCTACNTWVESAYLDETADKAMFAKPGIYRRRINLVSYWDLKNDSSVYKAREQASANGILLAGLAAVGAYAAQDPGLYQAQDGKNLPFFDIADLRSGTDGLNVAFSFWERYDRKVYFYSFRSGIDPRRFAQPSFVQEY